MNRTRLGSSDVGNAEEYSQKSVAYTVEEKTENIYKS